MIVGAHIAKKSSLIITIKEIIKNGGNALQFFSSNPRSSTPVDIKRYSNDFDEIKTLDNFHLVIHSSYVINIASSLLNNKRTIPVQDIYWFQSIIADLELAHYLNCYGTIIHVGKHTKLTPEEGLLNMKNVINSIILHIQQHKLSSKIILETAAGQGTELLVNIDDLISFYKNINNPKYFKLCFDTCHIWSAGYDLIESYVKIQKYTNNGIGVIHLNGSSTPKNSRKDRHSMIREGTIPINQMEEFISFVKKNDKNVIIILETPSSNLEEEIQYIHNI